MRNNNNKTSLASYLHQADSFRTLTDSKVQGFKEITKAEVLSLQGNHSKRHIWAHDFKTKKLFCHTQIYYQKYFAEVYLETSMSNT